MQKVIHINLNGNSYELDESGYDALREYLARAERALEKNPDRVEIMADLEQAIADKCRTFLAPHKSVVTAGEVEQIVKEMGPIDATTGEEAEESADASAGARQAPRVAAPPKRLYRIPDGAMIAGVCNGLASYLGIDVAFVRIAFALAAFFTKGAGFIAYVVMMFVVPEARTTEERASAGSAPFNAKDVVDRAKEQYTEGARHWRRHWRQQQSRWRRYYGWTPGAPVACGVPPWAPVVLPVFALVHLALFLTLALTVVSLVNTGAILSWHLPPGMPVWAGTLILLVGYQIVVAPIRAAQQWAWHPRAGVQPGWYAFWNAVVWMIGLAVMFWLASNHMPEIREFLQRLPQLARGFGEAIHDILSR